MSIRKEEIVTVLEQITAPGEGKSLVENNNLKNVVVFGDEVVVDVAMEIQLYRLKRLKLKSQK